MRLTLSRYPDSTLLQSLALIQFLMLRSSSLAQTDCSAVQIPKTDILIDGVRDHVRAPASGNVDQCIPCLQSAAGLVGDHKTNYFDILRIARNQDSGPRQDAEPNRAEGELHAVWFILSWRCCHRLKFFPLLESCRGKSATSEFAVGFKLMLSFSRQL